MRAAVSYTQSDLLSIDDRVATLPAAASVKVTFLSTRQPGMLPSWRTRVRNASLRVDSSRTRFDSPVIGVAAGLGAQVGHDVAGGTLPVGEAPCARGPEEHEPGNVGRPERVDIKLGAQSVAEPLMARLSRRPGVRTWEWPAKPQVGLEYPR
jgi:hypothetical protein